jgi:hypothetical protein
MRNSAVGYSAFNSHQSPVHIRANAPLLAFERVYNGVRSGFDELLAQEQAAQCWSEVSTNHVNPTLSQALVPMPGTFEFSQWTRQFGALANIQPGYISELFAIRVHTAVHRLHIIRAHLINTPPEGGALIGPAHVHSELVMPFI